jgi:hypothetical protein
MPLSGWQQRARQRHRWAYVVVLLVANWYLWSSTAAAHSAALDSTYVQDHGVRVGATVIAVVNDVHKYITQYGRPAPAVVFSSWTRAVISVRLDEAVNGAVRSAIGYPAASTLEAGDRVTVLIDPRHPRYGELPGRAGQTPHGWLVLLVLAILVGLPLLLTLSIIFLDLPKPKSARQADKTFR